MTIEAQKQVCKLLGCLDNNISTNIEMSKTLEEIARAIFKHWFIDFEFPNENGKPYKSCGGEMIDSHLGPIPKGWRAISLNDLGTLQNGVNYSRNEAGDREFMIVNVRNIVNSTFISSEQLESIEINSNKATGYKLRKYDIVIARSANAGEASLFLSEDEQTIFSGFTIRFRPHNTSNAIYLYNFIANSKQRLSDYSNGTIFKNITQSTLKQIPVLLPDEHVLARYNRITTKLMEMEYMILKENLILSTTRDVLLPELLTGRKTIDTKGD